VARGRDLDLFEGRGRGGFRRRPRRNSAALTALFRLAALGVLGAIVVAGVIVFMRRSQASLDVDMRVLWAPGVAAVSAIEGPDGEALQVVAGATIIGPDGAAATTNADGDARLSFEAPATLVVEAPGFHSGTFQVTEVDLGPERALYLQIDPIVLDGRVLDENGNGIKEATVRLGERVTTTEEFGSFEFVAAVPGTIAVEKAAWEPAEMEWDGSNGRLDVILEPFLVRGLRVGADAAGTPATFQALLEIADTTAVNALVFDTKQEYGTVMYDSQVAEAREIGAVEVLYDVEAVLAAAKEHDLYTITRIVTFQDAIRGPARPEHAIRDATTGDLWVNDAGITWMDPTDRGAWEYPIALAVEACEFGFDEIQFDYVRFPTDGDVSNTQYDVPVDETVRIETIRGFLTEARRQIHQAGCAVSADIFAIVLSVPDDQGLGQMPEDLSFAVDAISPMIYPSHYGPGWLGFDNPNDFPEEVVEQAVDAGMPRMVGGAVLRPWLQAFGYDADQVRAGIDVAEERDLGWLLWNAFSDFSAGGIPPE